MKELTCKQILLVYLKNNPGQHTKGSLYLIGEEAGFSPETTGRKLRELEEEKSIKVDYYSGRKGQKLARYSYQPKEITKLTPVFTSEGTVRMEQQKLYV